MLNKIKIKHLLYTLIVLQVLDGVLTYFGLQAVDFNLKYEGNPLVRLMMANYGVLNAIIVAKSIGVFVCCMVLVFRKELVTTINKFYIKALFILTILVYLVFAVLGWSCTLLFKYVV